MNREGSNKPVHGQPDGRDPVEAFIAGEGPLAAALRDMPAFDPPARMAGEFQRMLADMPAAGSAFEPPARLEAAVLAEIALQQAAQSTRRKAVLGEVARGADPSTALDAKLSTATEDWLRERSLSDEGLSAGAGNPARTAAQGDGGTKQAGKQRRRWPARWWRYTGGGLAAVLALGVGLRMTTEPAPEPASVVFESESAPGLAGGAGKGADVAGPARGETSPQPQQAPQVMRQRSDETARKLTDPEAGRREAIRSPIPREQAMQDRPAMAPPPRSANAPAPPPTSDTQAARTEQRWSLSDDPASRLASLPAGSHWILLCHPADLAAAQRWVQRGLDESANDAGLEVIAKVGVDEIRIKGSGDLAVGSLRIVRDD